jgi:hypothetical protein
MSGLSHHEYQREVQEDWEDFNVEDKKRPTIIMEIPLRNDLSQITILTLESQGIDRIFDILAPCVNL